MLIHMDHSLMEVFEAVKQELKRATFDKKHPFRYTVLSTQSDHVRSRYVVLREIAHPFQFIIYTDNRSRKVKDLAKHNEAQLLFYHPKKQVQVILTGYTSLLQHEKFSNEAWSKVQGNAQRAYNTLKAPGTPINDPKDGHLWREAMDDEHFAVITIDPHQIEVLQLNRLEHIRASFQKSDDWKGQWLVPSGFGRRRSEVGSMK